MALQQFKEGSTYFGYNPDTQQAAAFSTPEAFKAAGFSDFDPNAQAPTFDTTPLMAAPDRFVNVQLNPSTTTNTDTLSQPPVTTQDIQSLIQQNQEFQNKVLGYFTPTAEETKAQQELDNLDTSFRQGMNQIEDKVIPMPFITGQQASVERRYQTNRATAVQNLSRLQNARNAALQAAQQQVQFGQNNIATQLQLEKIAKDEQAAGLQMALEYGIKTPFFNVGGTFYDTSTGKPFTSEQDFQKRTGMTVAQALAKQLVQTIEPTPEAATSDIAEYQFAVSQGYTGSYIDWLELNASRTRRSTSTRRSSNSDFTDTQLAKGAAAAGMNIEDFAQLPEDDQNSFINGKFSKLSGGRLTQNDYNDWQDEIDDELEAGTDIDEIKDLLSSADIPIEDKIALEEYLDSKDTGSWWQFWK